MTKWNMIRGSKGKGRWMRYKKGKHTYEIGQKKVGTKWKRIYNYKVS